MCRILSVVLGCLTLTGCCSIVLGDFSGHQIKNFCYFTNWSPTKANFGARFDVENINATLCSHLIYAFANIDVIDLKLVKSETGDDNGSLTNKQGRYYEFNKLKIRHPDLVTLLSIGGANGKGWYQICANEASRRTFVQNVAIYLRDRDFDGIDLDWEWPGDLYRKKFTQLLQVLRREFEDEAVRTSKPKLLITIAVAVSEDTITKSYDIPEISSYVDYIQVMSYDFHGPWSKVTSFSSPLFSRTSNIRFNQQYSQQWAIDRWISGGAPHNKLVLGMTGTATTFTLANTTDAGVGAKVAEAGKTGPYMGVEGRATYYRACEMIRNGAVHHFDDEQKMGYAVMEDQWYGFPTPESMREKVRFAYSRGLAGTMFWALDIDDFKGTYCNDGQYPLLTAVYDTIQELAPAAGAGQFTVRTTEKPTTTTVDFRLHHRTNKNGVNFFDMVGSATTSSINFFLLISCFCVYIFSYGSHL